MFVVNFKLDFKKVFFACIAIAAIVATIVEFGNKNLSMSTSSKEENYDYLLTEANYIETLKTVHENIDMNMGKTIKMSGFVFRIPDFKENYFVCGRNSIVENENQVAGFLCHHQDSTKLLDNEWIEITGVITKGDYSGEIPIIKIGSINKITAPASTYVK